MQEREQVKAELAVQRTKWEEKHLGGYTRIYPTPDCETKYKHLFEAAQEIWANTTGVLRCRPLFDSLRKKREKNYSAAADTAPPQQTASVQAPQARDECKNEPVYRYTSDQRNFRDKQQFNKNVVPKAPLRSNSTATAPLGRMKGKSSPRPCFESEQQQLQQQQKHQQQPKNLISDAQTVSGDVRLPASVPAGSPVSLSSFCNNALINKQNEEAHVYANCKAETAPSQASTEEPCETADTSKTFSISLGSSSGSSTLLSSVSKLSSSSSSSGMQINLPPERLKELHTCVQRGDGRRRVKSEVYRQQEVYGQRAGNRGLPLNLTRVDVSFTARPELQCNKTVNRKHSPRVPLPASQQQAKKSSAACSSPKKHNMTQKSKLKTKNGSKIARN